MKKLKFSSISILIISMFFLTIIGCAGGSDSGSGATPKTDTESVAADKADLIDSDIQGANTDLNNITGNLTLPATGASGTTIAWSSNPTGVIAADGTITRPASSGSDATVTLTATITKGTVTVTKDFTVIVLKIPVDEQAVADDKASLVDTSIKGTNPDLSNVTTNITLPALGASISNITWAITSGTGISISGTTGTVTRPSYGSSDATVIITATIQKGSYSDTKIFTIIILAITTSPAQTAVDVERDKLTVTAIGSFVYGENALTKAQTLVSSGYTVSIASSSNTPAISLLGAAGSVGSSYVVFKVAKDGLTADTEALALTVGATNRNWRSIAGSSDGTKLAACVVWGYIYTSTDSGDTWTARMTDSTKSWMKIASSSDGTKLAAVDFSQSIYTSDNSGATWTQRDITCTERYKEITISDDGKYLVSGIRDASSYYAIVSTDSGATWNRTLTLTNYTAGIAASRDGKYVVVAVYGRPLYISADYGATWTERFASSTFNWYRVTISDDGTKLAALQSSGDIYTSVDSGASWTARTIAGSGMWDAITSSRDGSKLFASDNSIVTYTSTDYGATWTNSGYGFRSYSLTISTDGTKLAAVHPSGPIYTSTDSGLTWTPKF